MKYRIVLFGLLAFTIALKAQQFNVSMKPGDVRVYKVERMFQIDRYLNIAIDTAGAKLNQDSIDDTVACRAFGNCLSDPLIVLYRETHQTISDSGILKESDDNGWKWYDKYPLSPFTQDTLTLFGFSNTLAEITRRFDTTIFGLNVRAFDVILHERSSPRELTIADVFGLVRMKWEGDTTSLIRAKLAGTAYNKGHRKFTVIDFCKNNTKHFQNSIYKWGINSLQSQYNFSHAVLGDTNINGARYFALSISGRPPSLYRNDSNGLYRYDPVSGTDVLELPSDLTIGDVWQNRIVIDTSTREFHGKELRCLILSNCWVDWIDNVTYLEGIGYAYRYIENTGTYYTDESLVYLKHCGQTFGTPLLSEDPITVADFSLSHPYPNPISSTLDKVTIEFTLPSSAQVLVELYDFLGRKIRTITEGFLPSGRNSILIPTQGLQPGMYLTRIRTSSGILTQKFIVE